jgi:hypothetical protein
VQTLLRFLIPLALAVAVVVSAATAQGHHQRTKPAPVRALQLHR